MDLSIIIVNYNVRAFLENALVSIQKAMRNLEGEIFVVDNASDDGSVEMLQTKFPNVQLTARKENLGFAKANNLALNKAKGKYFLLINPDTIVQEDTLETMMKFFEQHSEVGLATCKVMNPDGTLQLACRRSFPTPFVAFSKLFGFSDMFPQSKLFGKYNLTYLPENETREVDAVSGSFMFLRRAVFEKIGGLDEDFFMYGEDLDWCYRVQHNGWKVFYVPTTQIIHYKGESTRRSSIDEVKIFYNSMQLFVKKHFRSSVLFLPFLQFGILLRSWLAFIGKNKTTVFAMAIDSVFIILSLILAEYFWRGRLNSFPSYAYPAIYIFSVGVILFSEFLTGALTKRKTISSASLIAVIASFTLLSALTFFFKEYGFSRMVTILAGMFTLMLLPGWRLIAHIFFRMKQMGKRSVIVGVTKSGEEIVRKLRSRVDHSYDVVGFIDTHRQRIGEKVNGVEILGSVDTIGRVIQEQKVSDVIFSTDALSYTDILSVIARSRDRNVSYRLVPSSLEAVIGKTSIDELESLPFVDIAYNIHQPFNRFVKRMFDIFLSLFLLLFYPLVKLFFSEQSSAKKKILLIPKILNGEMSFVGRSDFTHAAMISGMNGRTGLYLGKAGLTGLAQINSRNDMNAEEIETYNLYYAKNQSLLLDVEILIKSFFFTGQK
jgi:GT2 family glycosyltransferase/lipopolysaccharide/colanic/teichoic acid biosynthesis glycosyltransferase